MDRSLRRSPSSPFYSGRESKGREQEVGTIPADHGKEGELWGEGKAGYLLRVLFHSFSGA